MFWDDRMFEVFGLRGRILNRSGMRGLGLIHPDDREEVRLQWETARSRAGVCLSWSFASLIFPSAFLAAYGEVVRDEGTRVRGGL